MSNNQGGFTLVELLIALALFALLGIACSKLFDLAWRAELGLTTRSQSLRELQRTFTALDHDALHAVTWYRPLYLDRRQLTFGSAGWRNPLDLPRSELQQVSYQFSDGELWRHARGDNGAVTQRRLLSGIKAARWQVLGKDNLWLDGCEVPCRPAALRLTVEHSLFGTVTRLLRWPGHGR
ncbi:type II secretion system protein GspJ [Pseudomonas sp. Marseille-Q5115]|uniref:type II secretion system protein GspJ n=1 Tax=Pseudomonas sp. Marseille-Q5115 TaxID=2866593 RepID=UPI001CE3F6E8|nr:type II secretion system protein GspJ [Pseudomonas sp. Marseille-Q5115]